MTTIPTDKVKCSSCGNECFARNTIKNGIRNGKQIYKCRPCREKTYQKHKSKYIADASFRNGERRREYKQKAFQTLGSICSRCKISDIRVLQFDHINDDGKNDRNYHYNEWKFLKEIFEKTRTDIQLLCANCHMIKTFHSAG